VRPGSIKISKICGAIWKGKENVFENQIKTVQLRGVLLMAQWHQTENAIHIYIYIYIYIYNFSVIF
jgi:hypothetical protein